MYCAERTGKVAAVVGAAFLPFAGRVGALLGILYSQGDFHAACGVVGVHRSGHQEQISRSTPGSVVDDKLQNTH
jgi:hypothetical protein